MYSARVKKKHTVLRRLLAPFKKDHNASPDRLQLALVAALIFFGLIALSSATAILSFKETQQTYLFLERQLLHGLLPGIIAFFIAAHINYQRYRKLAPWFLILTFILLIVVLIPGVYQGAATARSWINIGSISVQTSEIAKIAFIIWLADWIARNRAQADSVKSSLFPLLFIFAGIALLLRAQPDIGTLALYALTTLAMYFASGAPVRFFTIVTVIMILAGLIFTISSEYRRDRLIALFKPNEDAKNIGWQTSQSLIALGSGSWFGVGIGQSQQKFQFLPELESDSIFAVIGEEGGFFITSALLFVYWLLFSRGMRIASRAPDLYSRVLAVGATFLFTSQAIVNVGAMIGVLPLTGVPLPFISLGGSNLVTLLIAIGILHNISLNSHAEN